MGFNSGFKGLKLY